MRPTVHRLLLKIRQLEKAVAVSGIFGVVTGKSLDSPEKGMSTFFFFPKTCPKIVRRGCKHNFWTILAYFVDVLETLSNARPLQLWGVRKENARQVSENFGIICPESRHAF